MTAEFGSRPQGREQEVFGTRRAIVAGIASALLVCAVVLGAGYFWPPFALPETESLAERLALTLKLDLLVGMWLLFCVGTVARKRFFSTRDIAGSAAGPPGPRIQVDVAVLQNTLEQVVLAVLAHLTLAAVLRDEEMVLLPLLVVLFCIGRGAFWVGYRMAPPLRAFGFAVTFYPTVFAFVLAGVLAVLR